MNKQLLGKLIEEQVKTTNIMVDQDIQLSRLRASLRAYTGQEQHSTQCMGSMVSYCLCHPDKVITGGDL